MTSKHTRAGHMFTVEDMNVSCGAAGRGWRKARGVVGPHSTTGSFYFKRFSSSHFCGALIKWSVLCRGSKITN